MSTKALLFILILTTVYCISVSETLEFNLVLPTNDSVDGLLIHIIPEPGGATSTFQLTTNYATINATHQYIYTSETPISTELAYNYQVNYKNGTTITESFWRRLDECRLISSPGEMRRTKNEFFNQTQNELGLPKLPTFSGVTVIPPEYYDDNQVMTVSLQIAQSDLDAVIFNPNDEGEIYVKANMTLVSLESTQVYTKMKIRRAGGMSLHMSPYSYQIKLNIPGDSGSDVVIKFKAFPNDYKGSSANIIAEKAAADVCYTVGAPINFVSYVRLFINSENQGLYGMLEKVDENFVQKRFPYLPSAIGNLYKLETWSILNNVGFEPTTISFVDSQTANNETCCACYDNGCDVASPDCTVFDDQDQVCPTLDCCSCDWESNGDVDAETANCDVLTPYYEFIALGNAIIAKDPVAINRIINAEEYMRSLLCSLTVLNPDGYIYNAKNYYWYRSSVNGQFQLILYDQDTCFGSNRYDPSWNPYNWTMQGDLTDALILPTLFQLNSTLVDLYNELATNLLSQYYRSDFAGPMFERMNIFADFVTTYNPERAGVGSKTQSFQKYFITPLSTILQSQFGVPPSNPPTSTYSPVCDAVANV